MTRLTGIAVAAMLLAPGGQLTAWAQGGKTATYPVVALSVMVENGDPWKITGDGFAYESGAADGTRANIDKYGNLIISFGRPVRFDYTELLSGPGGLITDDYDNSYISTLNAGGKALQNLLHGESQCIKLNWQYDVAGGMRRHGFNRGPGPNQWLEDTTSYAVVSRLDDATWVVEPADDFYCGTYQNPDNEALVFSQVSSKGKWEFPEHGRYRLPFKLTLTLKQ